MAFAALTIDLNARLAKFEDDMVRVRKSMGGLEKSAGVLKAGLGGLFAGVGVAGLVAFAKNGIDAADALKDMSDRLGVSVKDLASFKLAAEQSGTSLDDVGKGIGRLSRSIGEAEGGNKKLAEALKALGITARDPKEALFQLADATEKIQDPTKRAALLSQVLGKSYQDLIPLLSQGSEELRRSAQSSETFSDAMARLAPNADRFNDQIAQLKINAAGAAASLLDKLLPSLISIGTEFSNGIRLAGGFGEAIRLFGFGINPFKSTGDNLETLGKRFIVIEQQAKRAREAGNKSVLANLESERSDVIKKIQYLTAIQKAGQTTAQKPKTTPGGIDFPVDKPSKAKGTSAKAIDPLASLLSQTDTAKFAEYTKLQDLLNARFEKGAINGKQYAEALTVLRKGYYTDELKAYADQLEYNLETERLVAEHLRETEGVIRDQANAWTEAGRALRDDMATPLEQFEGRLEYINELFRRGAIDAETFHRATADAFENVGNDAKKAADLTKDPFKSAFDEMGNALANFVSTGKLDFKSLVKDILAGLAQIAFKKALLGLAENSGSGGVAGFFGTIAKSLVASAKGNVFNSPGLSAYSGQIVSKPTVFPFAKGIGLMGEAGPEAIMPLRRGKDGKLGVASTGGAGVTVNVSVDASGSKVENDQGKSGEFGRMIGNAVRGVLIQEMRPGGMLA